MNKKQASIILTLIALIVCVGVLAAKVNESTASLTSVDSPFDVKDKENEEKASDDNKEATSSKNDYFYASRTEREQTDSQTIQTYKSIIEDKNTSKEKKDETTKKLNELTTARNYETRIELSIKSKGFEDALCLIEGEKVRLIVKSPEQLTEKQTIQIQESVHAVAKTKDVIIELKQ